MPTPSPSEIGRRPPRSWSPWDDSRAARCSAGGHSIRAPAASGTPWWSYLVGPKAIRNIPDLLRYEPGFSLDVIADLYLPIGEYDASQPLNLGQNKWYGRIGTPVVWQLGPWVPGRRTTLELLPSRWLFGDNDDFVGSTLQTDPMFQLEGHLTRDFTADFWGSLDFTSATGGGASIKGVAGEALNNLGAGLTLGYHINDNLQLTAGYMATLTGSQPTDLRMAPVDRGDESSRRRVGKSQSR